MKEIQNTENQQNVFLERMSHEIRTPMNSIIGLTYLSKENIENPKQVLENLDKIERSARFLRSFIDDILNLSLLESGRVADNKEEILLPRFLEILTEQVKKQAEEKHIQFCMEMRGILEQKYYFDGEKLKEALENTKFNACSVITKDVIEKAINILEDKESARKLINGNEEDPLSLVNGRLPAFSDKDFVVNEEKEEKTEQKVIRKEEESSANTDLTDDDEEWLKAHGLS